MIYNNLMKRLWSDCPESSVAVEGIHDSKVFKAFLTHERAVAIRFGQEMCVLALPLPDAGSRAKAARQIGAACAARLRATDVVGWLDHATIGIILAQTNHACAVRVAEKICRPSAAHNATALDYKIYVFPNKDEDLRVAAAARQPANVRPLEDLASKAMPLWKRAFDMALALIGIILISPLLLLLALGIKLVSPGPVLFRQERVGYLGRRFTLYKFRSMKVVAETQVHQDHLGKLIKTDTCLTKLDRHDARLIPFGRIFRASGLDELPQLFNILRGDMSFIGPRPCVPYEYEQFQHWHRGRCNAYPGLTGLWQVSGKNKTTFTEMMRFDNAYARHQTLRQDLRIFCMTIPAILGQMRESAAELR